MDRKRLTNKYFKNKTYYQDTTKDIVNEDVRHPDIIFLMSGRKRGKSFRVSANAIMDAWYDDRQFGYIRRLEKEIKGDNVESYFADKIDFIKDMTDGQCDCVIAERGHIYLGKLNIEEKGNKREKVKEIGRVFACAMANQYKSLQYPQVYTLIYEEVFTTDGYAIDEPSKLLSIISTVRRDKRDFKCYLISNLVSRINPYVNCWGLRGLKSQKSGTIDNYKLYMGTYDAQGLEEYLYIACEYLEDAKMESKHKQPGVSIESNTWDEIHIFPNISERYLKDYKPIDRVVFEFDTFMFLGEIRNIPERMGGMLEEIKLNEEIPEDIKDSQTMPILYIKRKSTDVLFGTRLYTNIPTINPYATLGIQNVFEVDKTIHTLLSRGWVIYADNLTGNEFEQIINEL